MTYYERQAAQIFGCDAEDIYQKRRFRPLVEARNAVFYFLKTEKDMSLIEIMNQTGFDHATVLHGIRNVNVWKETDKVFSEKMELYIDSVTSPIDSFKDHLIA